MPDTDAALMALFSDAIAWFALWLFARAAWHKFSALDYYAGLLGAYGLREPRVARAAAIAVAATELGVALSVAYPPTRFYGACVAGLLLFGYAALLAVQLWMGKTTLDCGCGGADSGLRISAHLPLRNLALMAVLAPCVLAPAGTGPGAMAWASLALAGLVALLYQCCELIIANAQKLRAIGA